MWYNKFMINSILSEILLYITDFSKWARKYVGEVNLPELRYDWLVIFFFVFVIVIVALSLGRTRMLLALLSLYVAAFLESRFIWLEKLREVEFFKGKPDFWLHLTLFFVIYFVVFGILSRSILKPRLSLAEASIFSVLAIAFFEIGFLAAIILNYFPAEFLERIPPRLMPYFTTKTALFVWAALSILFLLTLRRKNETHIPKI